MNTTAKAASDTSSARIREVKVVGSRILSKSAMKYSSSAILTREEIVRIGATGFGEVLSGSAGIYVKDYGGFGALKTVSIRGAAARQTLVMLDGMKINSAQNGIADLSVLPTSMLESVEILRGGASAQYGGGAVGGVVNLNSSIVPSSKPIDIEASLKAGVWSSYFGNFNIVRRIDNSSLAFAAEYVDSRGDYPFSRQEFGETVESRRQNADFRRVNALVSGAALFDLWLASAKIFGRNSARGVPGAVLQGAANRSEARLDETEIMSILSARKEFDFAQLNIGSKIRFNETRFRDPLEFGGAGGGLDNLYINRDFALKTETKKRIENIDFVAALEFEYADLRGDMLDETQNSFVARRGLAFSASAERAEITLGEFAEASLFAFARYESVSSVGRAFSPMVGTILDIAKAPIIIKATRSANFRAPSFNEMYYFNYGASDLKPETSVSTNVGIVFAPSEQISAEIAGFVVDTRDQIVSVPKSPISWSAENLAKTKTYGVEIEVSSILCENNLEVKANAALQKALDVDPDSPTYRKRLIYVPETTVSASANADFGFAKAGGAFRFVGDRYSRADAADASLLQSYWLVDVYAIKEFKFFDADFEIRFDCKNIFDEEYFTIQNYPIPGRYFQTGIRAKL